MFVLFWLWYLTLCELSYVIAIISLITSDCTVNGLLQLTLEFYIVVHIRLFITLCCLCNDSTDPTTTTNIMADFSPSFMLFQHWHTLSHLSYPLIEQGISPSGASLDFHYGFKYQPIPICITYILSDFEVSDTWYTIGDIADISDVTGTIHPILPIHMP